MTEYETLSLILQFGALIASSIFGLLRIMLAIIKLKSKK